MEVTVGTFNLNNLFSRYNFKGKIDEISDDETGVGGEIKYEFSTDAIFKIRTYMGKLVKAKDPDDSQTVAERIISMNVDVLGVQEVEDIDTLKQFNTQYLNGMYSHIALVEGNDPRLIDVGLMSKLPIGAMSSWRFAVHEEEPEKAVFGRDLMEVEILNKSRTKTLFRIFNNHLKSHFVPYYEDQDEGELKNSTRRRQQAEMICEIVKKQTRPDSRYIILGDMNDAPHSPDIQGFVADAELNLTNALENPTETQDPKDDPDSQPPASGSWTHRFKESGEPAAYELYDHIWLSQALAENLDGAWIDRRTKHGGDGSDHDPAWVKLQI